MDPSGINNFEDQWRKALSDASETPPKFIWENIEARLDESEQGGVLPLWWQSKKLWLAAASVAALLVVGAGFWYSDIKNKGAERTELAAGKTINAPATSDNKVSDPGITSNPAIAANRENENAIAPNLTKNPERTSSQADSKTQNEELVAARKSAKSAGDSYGASAAGRFESERSIAKSEKPAIPAASNKEPVISITEKEVNDAGNESVVAIAEDPNRAITENNNAEAGISVGMLTARAYNELDVHMQKRYVFFKPDAIVEEEIIPKKNKEYWAGVGVMPASFNPNVQVKQTPQAFSYQALSSRKAVSGSSEAGVSYALQTQGGVRLSKHWSVELGLSYLQGNSSYEGGGYLLNAYSQSANVLENAIADASPKPSFSTEKNFNNGALYIDVAKKVSNNYQYLQMPLQAGFTLNPDKKLSYSLLGGMMANFFLSNDLESASGEIITTKASDDVYRSMNWAATTGLRFNYRLSSKWKANLTGSYQRAISSGFRSNQTLDAHPYLYGVAWGVRYSF